MYVAVAKVLVQMSFDMWALCNKERLVSHISFYITIMLKSMRSSEKVSNAMDFKKWFKLEKFTPIVRIKQNCEFLKVLFYNVFLSQEKFTKHCICFLLGKTKYI